MVHEKVQLWFNVLGIGWVITGGIALGSILLAKIVSPVFYVVYLVFPYGPYYFVYGEWAAVMIASGVALLFITIGLGLHKRTKWSRLGSVFLAAATTLYFTAVLVGLWSSFVKRGNVDFLWLAIPAIIWLATMVPSLYFLTHKESEQLFGNSLPSSEGQSEPNAEDPSA
mgnify:CR=1 FL=1